MKTTYYSIALSLSLLFTACRQPGSEKKRSTAYQRIPYFSAQIATARDSTHLGFNKRKALLDQAYSNTRYLNVDSLRIQRLAQLSQAYLSLNDSVHFRKINSQLLQAPCTQNCPKTLGNIQAQRALFFRNQGKLDSAFYHYSNALENYEQLPLDSIGHLLRGNTLYEMGKIQGVHNDYLGVESTIVAAIKHFREAGHNERLYACYTVLGAIANASNRPKKALNEYNQAKAHLAEADFAKKEMERWRLQNNMAAVHFKVAAYAKAQPIYAVLLNNKALQQVNPELYTKVMTNQAYAYFKGSHNIPKAQALLEQAMALNDSLQFWHDQSRTQRYYAELLAAQGDTLTALRYAKVARTLAQNTSNDSSLLEILQLLSQIDRSHSIRHSSDYYALNTKLQNEERTKRDKFARIRLETDDLIAENLQLNYRQYIQKVLAVLLVLLCTTSIGIILNYLYRRTQRHRKEQYEVNQEMYTLIVNQESQLAALQKEEKARISGELHDGVLGEMLGIRLVLGALNKRHDGVAIEERKKMINSLHTLEENIRIMSHELHKEAYEEFKDIVAAIKRLLKNTHKAFDTVCTFTYEEEADWNALPGVIKMNLYRIVQEAMKNGMTHGKCTAINIGLHVQAKMPVLSVVDNGIGFDPKQRSGGIGLKNINMRAQKIEGTLDIISAKNKGTNVRVTLPKKYMQGDDAVEPTKEQDTKTE